MARSLSAPFIECSAADGVNVDVAFSELVKLIRKEERVSLSLEPCDVYQRYLTQLAHVDCCESIDEQFDQRITDIRHKSSCQAGG
jgi:hypothetical protein